MEEATNIINTRMVSVIAIALYTRSPGRQNFLQKAIGIDMWRQGASQQLYGTFNLFGLSQMCNAARNNVDKITLISKEKILIWKNEVEVSVLLYMLQIY